MVRITVEDLPVLEELTHEEMADIVGGGRGTLGDVETETEVELPQVGTIN